MESKIYINDSDHKELPNKEETSRKLLWVDISHFSELWQFIICSFVVFIFFIPYGYLQVYFILFVYLYVIYIYIKFQETIFAIKGFKQFGWYLTLIQFFNYSVFGLIESQINHKSRR